MNNELTNKKMSPKRVIVIYQDQSQVNPEYYLESREIKNINGKQLLTAPVPMADDTLASLAKVYVQKTSPDIAHGPFLHEHILHGSNEPGKTVVVWYRPAKERKLNLSKHMGIKGDNLVHVPATLFVLINKSLYIYALMDNNRPIANTKLYNAPFFHISSADGNVCLGTADTGKRQLTYAEEAERFEKAFFMAEQSHGNVSACKTPLTELWTKLIQDKKPFPSKDELKEHAHFKTLRQLFWELLKINISKYEY